MQAHPDRLPRYGFLYETRALEAFTRSVTRKSDEDAQRARTLFLAAFHCWRALATLDETPSSTASGSGSRPGLPLPALARSVVVEELAGDRLEPTLTIALRLAVSGLIAEHTAETRLELSRFAIRTLNDSAADESDWRTAVLEHVAGAFVLLVRKAGGWEDIDQALASIQALRELQKTYEAKYLDGITETSAQTL